MQLLLASLLGSLLGECGSFCSTRGWPPVMPVHGPPFVLAVMRCHGACAEVDSDTEAVAGKGFKLGCISCKKRSEVESSSTVEWYFRPKGEADFVHVSVAEPRRFRQKRPDGQL